MVPRLPTSLHSLVLPEKKNPSQEADFLRQWVAHSIFVLTANPLTGLNNRQLSKDVSCLLNSSTKSYICLRFVCLQYSIRFFLKKPLVARTSKHLSRKNKSKRMLAFKRLRKTESRVVQLCRWFFIKHATS